jgi:hypothetical protein
MPVRDRWTRSRAKEGIMANTETNANDRAFAFLPVNRRPSKPQTHGATESLRERALTYKSD